MKERGWAARRLWILALGLGLALEGARGQGIPPLPVEPYKKNDKGLLVASVRFDAQGNVADCRIARSNVPYPLEVSTVDYIRRKWVNEALANTTSDFPITFDELPWYAKSWDDGMIPPPNWLKAGDPERNLKLEVTFGTDGWIQRVKIVDSSGVQLIDQQTGIWLLQHWHSDAYEGRTVDVPFEFKSPASPRPVVVKVPPKPAPEEAAPPAVRVE